MSGGGERTLTVRIIGNSKSGVAAISETEAAASGLSGRLAAISQRFATVGAKMTSVGRTLTHRVTLPVVAAGAASVKMATDFDSAMTQIQTQAGASADDVKWLSKQVLDLAAKAQQSPLELAHAMYHLKSVGLDNVQAMKALKQATDMAAVGQADLEETTNAVAGAWRTGIKGAHNFKGAVSTLNAIIGAGNMRMSDLNDAMGTGFLASGKTFGLTLKDVGSALALMTDEGIPADAAATRLRMSFSLLGAPSKAAAKQLATIGLSAKDLGTALRQKGIVGAIGMLKEHLKGLSKVDASQVLSRAFGGGRSSSAIMTLLNNFDVLKKKEDQVAKSAGKFGAAVAKQAKTPKAQFALLISTIETLAVRIGNKLLPFVVKAAQALNRFLGWVSKLPAPMQKMAGIFALIAAAAGPVLMIVGSIATGIAALLTPVGLAVAAVAVLAAGFAYLYTHSAKFRAFVASFMPILRDLASQFMEAVVPAVRQVGNLIKTELLPAFVKILPIIGPIARFLLKMFGDALIGTVKGAIQFIKGFVQVLAGVISLVADLIHGDWHAVWHDLVLIVKGVLNMIIGAFKVWWNGGILSIFHRGFSMLLSLVKGGWRGLVRLAEEGMGLWKRVIDKVVSILTWPFRKAFTETRSYVSSGWRYIRGEFSGGVGGIRAVLSRLLEVITYPYRAAFSAAKAIVRGAWHALHGDFSAMPGSIRNILGRIPGIVRGIFSGAGGWLLNAGSRIIHGLISGITGALGALRSKLSVVTKLIPKWKGPADVDRKLLTPNGHLVMDGFLRGLENRMPKIKASLGAFTSGLSKGLSGDRGSFRYAARATRSRPLLAGPAGSVGDGGIHVHLTVQGSVISERDLISKVRSGIAKAQRTAGKPATTR